MDWESVKEKVTREVLRQLEVAQREPGAPASVTVDESFKCDVLLVLGGPVTGRVAVAARAMAAGSRVVAVAAEGTEGLGALDGVVPVLTGGTDTSVRRLVQGASVILAPVATVSLAAKVSSLIGDCFPSAVLVQAALSGKAAVIARDGLVEYEGGNWAVRRKVEEIISTLRSLGITVGEQPADLPATGPTAAAPAKAAAAVVTAARAEVAVGSPEGEYDQALAGMIDHTLLKPEATAEQVAKLCSEARQYGFMSVCVNPTWVPLAAEQLKGSAVKVCTVLGFPLGATASEVKAFEADWTIRHGATEVDMVLNVGALKSGNHDLVLSDVKAVVEAARGRALVKVILETGLLTEAEKVTACEICKEAGADFVKTSTGFGPGGATVDDIALMRRTVGPTMGVKASGGIRDYDAALAVARAGASRIGASASINIVKRVKAQPAAGKEKY